MVGLSGRDMSHGKKWTGMGRTTPKGQMKCWVGEKEKMQLPKSSSRVEKSGKSIGHNRFLRQ